ncbi:MAG: VCBS repeat-containing protein [Planctomycetota bacterium]
MTPFSPRSIALVFLAVTAACARHSGTLGSLVAGGTPTFETRTEIDTRLGKHADFVVADFNNDGLLDMAVISIDGELGILLGNGTSLVLGQRLQIGGVPSWIASGDFDNDGDIDLVVVRSAEDSTDIWLNNGGTFSAGASLPVGTNALSVDVGDLDQDGNLDIAVSLPLAPEIVVAFGDGTGAFPSLEPLALPGGGSAFNLQIGDVTRDGRDDLIVADPQLSRVVIFPGQSGGNFGSTYCVLEVTGAPGAVSLGDLSGDGLPDMVVAAFDANKYVVITEILPAKDGGPFGNIYPYQSFDIPVPARPSISTVADVTGDGLPDLVACLAFHANLCVVPQLPGGGVGELFCLDSTGLPLRPFVGDFDKNGKNDVFALSGLGDRVNLWRSNSTGRLLGARNYASGLPGSSWIEGGDFDGDGDFEIVVGSTASSVLSWLGRDAAGALRVAFSLDVGLPIYQIKAADLNGDGKPDLVVAVPGGVRLVQNRSVPGTYGFGVLPVAPVTFGSSTYPFGIALGDFDRDGDFDIALCDSDGGGLHIVPGTATPFVFGPETIVMVGGGPMDVVAADFSGDGLLDLAVSRSVNSDILVLRNQGVAGFTEFLTVPVGDSPNYLITADFNRDGRADLVVSNAASGSVTVLFGTPNGFTGQDFAAGLTPTALMAKDLTGDGVDDILVASLRSGDFRVMVGDGNGGFPLLPTFPGTLGASDALLQDMDGDGRPDLMITSLITNRVSLVRNITEIPGGLPQ